MEGLRPMLDQRGHQDVQAGAHMEGVHCCCCRRIQAHLQSRALSLLLSIVQHLIYPSRDWILKIGSISNKSWSMAVQLHTAENEGSQQAVRLLLAQGMGIVGAAPWWAWWARRAGLWPEQGRLSQIASWRPPADWTPVCAPDIASHSPCTKQESSTLFVLYPGMLAWEGLMLCASQLQRLDAYPEALADARAEIGRVVVSGWLACSCGGGAG